jgi:hypothetical protein
MTTVSVRIERLGSGDRLYLQNGMWGPTTTVLHAFGRACQDGRIPSSKWNIAEINEITTGAVVRQALDSIGNWDWQQSRDSTDRERVAAFRDRLVDSAQLCVRRHGRVVAYWASPEELGALGVDLSRMAVVARWLS